MQRRRRSTWIATAVVVVLAFGAAPATAAWGDTAPAASGGWGDLGDGGASGAEAAGGAGGAIAGEPRTYQRAYLLANSGGFMHWSFDPFEEAADVRETVRRCPTHVYPPGEQRCHATAATNAVTTGVQLYALNFYAWSRLAEPLVFNADEPLRFRLAMDVDGATDFTVQLHARSGLATRESEPAVEVEPGVWEGTVTQPGTLAAGATVNFGIIILTAPQAPLTVRLATDGSSFVELPRPVAGWSLGDHLRDAPRTTEPEVFATEQRTFRFHDDRWEAHEFEGDLTGARTFGIDLDAPAAAVTGWVEAFAEPVLHAAAGGQVDPARVTDAPRVSLRLDGDELDHGRNDPGVHRGRGMDAAAAVNVGAGRLELVVEPTTDEASVAYRAYLLVIDDPRSLHSVRWVFSPRTPSDIPQANAAGFAFTCTAGSEPIPLTPTVTAVRVHLTWDSLNPSVKFTPTAGGPSCAELGNGPTVTRLPPGPEVLRVSATPARDAAQASYRDVLIDAEVRVYHAPAG